MVAWLQVKIFTNVISVEESLMDFVEIDVL